MGLQGTCLHMSAFVVFLACFASVCCEGPVMFEGDGWDEYIAALNIAARQWNIGGDVELQVPTMIYSGAYNAMLEGPTWDAWWTQNSYGPTLTSLPFVDEPYLTWLQNSQDWWWKFIGDGKTKGNGGYIGPDGCLCDAANAKGAWYRQGDGEVALHDWTLEESLSAVIMQAEAVLISRSTTDAARFSPLFRRALDFVWTRFDGTEHVFASGPSTNLLAPSYGGVLYPNGTRGWGYVTGVSVSYLAAVARVAEVEALLGNTTAEKEYRQRYALVDAGLPSFLAGNKRYFVKSVDPSGTRHGEVGAKKHGYFETSPNHDAIAHGIVKGPLAETIMEELMTQPLRPHGLMICNGVQSLDDMIIKDNSSELWSWGTWVNGGVWHTTEARLQLALYRMRRHSDALLSFNAQMVFANKWRMDSPLRDFGATVYQPKEPINNVIDAFGVASGFMRGLFALDYTASSLALSPSLPANLTRFSQSLPVRWGKHRITLSVSGSGAVCNASINGTAVDASALTNQSVVLLPSMLPASRDVHVHISLGASPCPLERTRVPSYRRGVDEATHPKSVMDSKDCALKGELLRQYTNLTHFHAGMVAQGYLHTYEAGHALAFIQWCTTLVSRCEGLANKTITPLPARASAAAAEASYSATAANLWIGLAGVLGGYAHSSDPAQQRIYAIWVGA